MGRANYEKGFSLFFFLPAFSSPHLSLPVLEFPHTIPFLTLSAVDRELLYCLIQTLCLHLSRSTRLRKNPIADHYLCVYYFQQQILQVWLGFFWGLEMEVCLYIYISPLMPSGG